MILLEVLSKSTESDDRGPKLDCYRTIASVRAVLLVAQDEPEVTVYERRADGSWSQAIHTGGIASLPWIACALALEEVYEDLPDE
jgi:Uma2 family endonuclease